MSSKRGRGRPKKNFLFIFPVKNGFFNSALVMVKMPASMIRDLHLLFLGISATYFVCLHLSIKSLIPSSEINIPYLFCEFTAFCEVMIYFFLLLCGNSLKRFTILILSNIVSLGIFLK